MENTTKNLTILDCTLRDGGYYNQWDFPSHIVSAYLKAVALAGIDYVELGLRNFPKPGFLGAFAYTTESFLNTLALPEGPTYGVMVDAKTILNAGVSIESAINSLFVPRSESKIGLVRVAAHFHEVAESGQIVKVLKELGYVVGFNLMQAGGKSNELIREKARIAKSWGKNLDVLYFADSLGNMDEKEVTRIIQAIRFEWSGPMGIHTHDNMNKGLDNSCTALANGVDWLDATVTGMGRGAGNTQTERLLTTFTNKYDAKPIYDLVIRYFEKMQADFGWGSNLLYFLGAKNDVHPTYIQNLLSNEQYGTEEIIAAINYLSTLESSASYDGSILDTAVRFKTSGNNTSGTNALVGLFEGKEVLVITSAESTTKYKTAVETYIKLNKPIVISVNINESIDKTLIDYYVISHNVKFLTDAAKYRSLNKPVILPKHRFSEDEAVELEKMTYIDYGFENTADELSIQDTYVSSKLDYTSTYLLGILATSKPLRVKLVGFDGYPAQDTRQLDMITLFTQFNALPEKVELTALTPTSYPINKGSVYAVHS